MIFDADAEWLRAEHGLDCVYRSTEDTFAAAVAAEAVAAASCEPARLEAAVELCLELDPLQPSCIHSETAEAECTAATVADEAGWAAVAAEATAIEFRPGVLAAQGLGALCVEAAEYCAALTYEVTLDIEKAVCGRDAPSMLAVLWLYAPWLAMVANNLLLKAVLRRLAHFEKHTSKSKLYISTVRKMFCAQFANTALVVLVVTATPISDALSALPAQLRPNGEPAGFGPRWYADTGGGLTLALLLNAVVPKLWVRVTEGWRGCCRRACCTMSCCVTTQEQLNARFAGQRLDLADRYSTLWNTIFSCFLFSSGMPLLLLVALFDVWLLSLTETYYFFRYYSRPEPVDEAFAVMTVELLPYAAIGHLVVGCWMYSVELIFTVSFCSQR
eukprot:SAG11_NODE_44_length_20765_cov_5.183635_3_plen_387_part_00